MEIDQRGRGAGKTFEMVHWAMNECGDEIRVIVVADSRRKQYLLDQYGQKSLKQKHGFLRVGQVVTAHHALNGSLRGQRKLKIGIDELGDVLRIGFGHRVEIANLCYE
jgi:hypothetical protein